MARFPAFLDLYRIQIFPATFSVQRNKLVLSRSRRTGIEKFIPRKLNKWWEVNERQPVMRPPV